MRIAHFLALGLLASVWFVPEAAGVAAETLPEADISSKLVQITLKVVQYDGTALSAVIKDLAEASARKDPQGRGVSLRVREEAFLSRKVSLHLRNVTLLQCLKYLAEMTELGLEFERDAVVLVPKPSSKIVTGTFPIAVGGLVFAPSNLTAQDFVRLFAVQGLDFSPPCALSYDFRKCLLTVSHHETELQVVKATLDQLSGAGSSPAPLSVHSLSPAGNYAFLVLLKAKTFTFGHVNFGLVHLPPENAWRQLVAEKAGSEAFHALVNSATPAGRLYGLCGLYRLDPTAFSTAAKACSGDQTPVETVQGCTGTLRPFCSLLAEIRSGAWDGLMSGGLNDGLAQRVAKLLGAMHEPSLFSLKDGEPRDQYRFIYLPTFHRPLVVRFWKLGGGAKCRSVRLSGKAGDDPLGPIETESLGTIPEAQWKQIEAGFAEEAVRQPLKGLTEDQIDLLTGMDGAEWILEERRGEKHAVTAVWSPPAWERMREEGFDPKRFAEFGLPVPPAGFQLPDLRPFIRQCRLFLDLAGVSEPNLH